jgi:serine/threonine protein kinase
MVHGLSAGSVFAGYRIEGLIGRGGMGAIYRATEFRPEREVALKVVAPEYAADVDFRARFLRESQIAASIEDPHVVPVLRVGEEDEILFIAMRLIRGSDLAGVLRTEHRLDPVRASSIVDQAADALDSAHELGLVHRDVKPANILIERRRRGDHVYLTDFGLTKSLATGGRLTGTGILVGTTNYMAPEQWQGGRLDARVDIYSLGCVLFEMLTGQVPFPLPTDAARMYAHLSNSPPAASSLVPGLSSRFDEVISRALAKNPDDRYPSTGDLGFAALAAAEGVPVNRAERSVAIGEAAPDGAATDVLPPTAKSPSPTVADRLSVPDHGERSAIPARTAVLPERTAPLPSRATTPGTRKRLYVLITALALIAAAGAVAAAVVLSSSSANSSHSIGQSNVGSGPSTMRAKHHRNRANKGRPGNGVQDLPVQCGSGVAGSSGVSCAFSENAFYEYWQASGGNPTQSENISVWSAEGQQQFPMSCVPGDGVVDCTGTNSKGASLDSRFSQYAVSAYTAAEAAAYAASGKLGPNSGPSSSSNTSGPGYGVQDLPVQCGSGVAGSSGVSCAFSENAFYEYWQASGGNPTQSENISVWSAEGQQQFPMSCVPGDGVVDCTGTNSKGASLDSRFSQHAVSAYTAAEAAAYAASGKLGPNSTP